MKKQSLNNSINQEAQTKYSSFPFDDFSNEKIGFHTDYIFGSVDEDGPFPAYNSYSYNRIGYKKPSTLQVLDVEECETLEHALDSMFHGSLKQHQLHNLLVELNNSNYQAQGIGKFKKVFKYKDYAILKELDSFKSNDGSIIPSKRDRVKKTTLLNNVGINTPQIIYQTTLTSENDDEKTDTAHYEIQENAKGLPIQLFRFETLYLLLKDRGLYPQTDDASKEDINKVCDKFQLAITKQRALVGQKHLPKFIDDSLVLHCLSLGGDFHGENILFNPETGYSFLDLSLKKMNKHSDINSLTSSVNEIISQDISDAYILKRFINIFSSALCLDSCFTHTKQSLHDNFPLYVYNGLILEQARKYLCGENPNEEPPVNLKDTRFFKPNAFLKNSLFAMPFNEINDLQKVFESGEGALQEIRDRYELPDYYNFDLALGKKDFMEAYNCTLSCEDSLNPDYQNIKMSQNWFGKNDDAINFQLSAESDSENIL